MDCSVCCESFTEEGPHVPRNLDCGHTFCTVCIQRLENHASARQGPRCPDCRAVIRFNRRPVTSLPKNYKLLELIREKRNQKPETEANMNSSTAVGTPAIPEEHPHPGMMFMGSYFPPIIANIPLSDWNYRPMSFRPQPVHSASLTEDLSRMRITTSASDEMDSRNHSSTGFTVQSSEAPPIAVPAAVESGRAVTGPDGSLVCKFFQEGTCRYGPHCWFTHPILNENKSLCRHWMKGQCRMGLNCNYRHGTQRCVPPIRPPRQRPTRDPSAPGPSGEGTTQSSRRSRPSVVVFVSNWGSTVHHPPPVSTRTQWGNLPTQVAGAAVPGFSSDAGTFFDDFSA